MKSKVVHISTVHALRDPRIFYKQVPSLASLGYDMHLVVPMTTNERREIESEALPFHVHGLRTGSRGLLSRAQLGRLAFKVARELKADVYHIHDPELIPVLRLLKHYTGARVIYDMHEDYGSRGGLAGAALRRLERWAFSWVDVVILADDAYLPIVEDYDVPVTCIYNYPLARASANGKGGSVDSNVLRSDTGRLINTGIYTGVISKARGLFELIELANAIDKEEMDWAIDLVGVCYIDLDRANAERQLAMTKAPRSLNRVGWNRFVDVAEMQPYLERASVGFILFHPHPNYVNVLPTKLYEYLQFGLPIICSNFPRLADFVAENNCGVALDPTDTQAIVDVLSSWSSNPELYNELSRNALNASVRFTWSEMEGELQLIYEEVGSKDSR